MKVILLIIFSFFCKFLLAQGAYEWSTGFQDVNATYSCIKTLPDGGIIAVLQKDKISYFNNYDPKFVQGSGAIFNTQNYWDLDKVYPFMEKITSRDLIANTGGCSILRLDKNGDILWGQSFRRDWTEIYQLDVHESGDISVLMRVKDDEYDENDNPVGYIYPITEELYPAGIKIVRLNSKGSLKSIHPIQYLVNDLDLEDCEFLIYDEEHYVLGGSAEEGKIASNLDATSQAGGGDFVMMINDKGIPVWADIVTYRVNSCCTRTGRTEIDISPDGTIYLASNYNNGAVFSNGEQTLVVGDYDGEKKSVWEGYVVSYSGLGKINWIKPNGDESYMRALRATDAGVYVVQKIHKDIAFGAKVDTSRRYQNVITFISHSGKVKWNVATMSKRIEGVDVNAKGELVMATIFEKNYVKDAPLRTIGEFELPKNDQLVILTINMKGEYTAVNTSRMSPSSEHMLLVLDAADVPIIAIEEWCSLSFELSKIDPSFPAVKCSGGVGVLAKIAVK